MIAIKAPEITPNPALTGQTVTISVTVFDVAWTHIAQDFSSWNDVLVGFSNWNSVKNYNGER